MDKKKISISNLVWSAATPSAIKEFFEDIEEKPVTREKKDEELRRFFKGQMVSPKEEKRSLEELEAEVNKHVPPYARGGCI